MLLISDANIFIDMVEGGLIDEMFSLPEEFAVPDILFEEELVAQHAELIESGLKVLEMDGETVAEAIRLRQKYNKPSQNDLNALTLAKKLECPLLTGDKDLRTAAKTEQHEVKGTLWLVQRLVEEALITVQQAEQSYKNMREANRRLPWDLVDQQIKDLKK